MITEEVRARTQTRREVFSEAPSLAVPPAVAVVLGSTVVAGWPLLHGLALAALLAAVLTAFCLWHRSDHPADMSEPSEADPATTGAEEDGSWTVATAAMAAVVVPVFSIFGLILVCFGMPGGDVPSGEVQPSAEHVPLGSTVSWCCVRVSPPHGPDCVRITSVDASATTRRIRCARIATLAQSAAIILAVAVVAVLITELGLFDLTSNSLWVVVPSVLLMAANVERRRKLFEKASGRHA